MTILAHHYLSDIPHKDAPMPHHLAGLQYTRSGYGSRIPTTHMVKLPGSNRWRRVYVCIWSNAGTAYVDTIGANGEKGWTVIL